MEQEDESTSYLKLFSEGPNNYLLNNSEEIHLNDGFPEESIFTEIGTEWSTEAFPILLSGSLVTETVTDSNQEGANIQVQGDHGGNTYLDKAVYLSNIDKNRLILSNDTFLQVEESTASEDNTITQVIDGNTYAITYSAQDYQDEHNSPEENNIEVIQLMDIDGTVTNIDKNLLGVVEEEDPKNDIRNYFTEVQANKCKFCNYLCLTLEEIDMHIKVEHKKQIEQINSSKTLLVNKINVKPETKIPSVLNNLKKEKYLMYLCSTCGDAYLNKEDLKQHMVNSHNLIQLNDTKEEADQKENNIIQIKETTNKDQSQINASLLKKQQRGMKKIKCSIKGCPLKFSKKEFRTRHEECHVNDDKKKFMCPVCKEKFSIWRICSMHLWKSHTMDVGMLSCPICDQFKSNSSGRILTHMAIHTEDKPHLCPICGKGFKQLNQLKNHEIIHKPQDKLSNCYIMKQCESCNRVFANAKTLKKHIKFVHEKFKPFICNICGHQTARKEMLQIHYRQHTGDKPYHCKYCEYKTGDRNCLRRHTMRHFGIAKYSCPHCNFQSIQSANYKIHLTNKHPGQSGTYSCTVCKYSTVNLEAYSAHVRCHEIEKSKEGTKQESTEDYGNEENIDNPQIVDDEETENCYSEDAVDTGGITIPAELNLPTAKE